MGLDMYVYIENKDTGEKAEYSYYRKFNALQGYFSEKYNLENCGRIQLTKKMVNEVYLLLNEVRLNPEKASILLPIYPGPFFGSYEYDQLYQSHVNQASIDFYHAKFLDFNQYNIYYTADW